VIPQKPKTRKKTVEVKVISDAAARGDDGEGADVAEGADAVGGGNAA